MYVIKKDGTNEEFNVQKIIVAVNKSAARILYKFTDEELKFLCEFAQSKAESLHKEGITIQEMHNIVEGALEAVNPAVAKSYRDYRNYKMDFIHMMDDVYTKSQSIRYIGDKSNANTDSALVATKRSLIFNELNKELYRKFFMTRDELQACKDGYIYIHDQSARLDTMNCCLFNVGDVLSGGFEMGNVWYNEPKTLDTAFDVMGDIILSTAAQQYGGFTVPEVDKILAPYAEKSFRKYKEEYIEYADPAWPDVESHALRYAQQKVRRDCDQGWQGIEYKLNTVGSSRGDYPFVTVTLGLGTTEFEKMISMSLLDVHRGGQGRPGNKKPVLFPKIVFLYDEALHGPGGSCEEVFEKGVECSSKTMYPDWLSLTGEGYISSMYKKYKKVISPMGCRAFLSPWYERGGMEPADENDTPVFVGRFNIGAVSLHLPMILAKARAESRDFYEVLDEYLEMIRRLHIRTYDYLGEMRASTNPLGYCEGGFYGGHLKPGEKIKNGTPAESLCGLQVEQFRKKYGIIENVSDRPYVSNSFHCHVTEDLTPIEKQDLEGRFWELCNGGKIQYVRYPIDYNIEAIKSLIRRAMALGFYEGVNLSLAYCDDCGHQELEMDVCPKCGSHNLTKIDRMNGYLSYSRVHGDTRLNAAKMAEIAERKSM